MKTTNQEKSLPEKKLRAGAVGVSIWKNQTFSGNEVREYFTVNLDKRYLDKDGVWKSTASLQSSDLANAILVLNKAYEFVSLKSSA